MDTLTEEQRKLVQYAEDWWNEEGSVSELTGRFQKASIDENWEELFKKSKITVHKRPGKRHRISAPPGFTENFSTPDKMIKK
jgi:hypothetical protein